MKKISEFGFKEISDFGFLISDLGEQHEYQGAVFCFFFVSSCLGGLFNYELRITVLIDSIVYQ